MHWIVCLLAMFAVIGAAPASAQTYPTKPIHIIVPYAPGGITDIAARIIGAKLTEAWGQQVVVENKPGGNGFIGMTAGAKAAPDGYTLTMATVGDIAINPAMFKTMPFDMQRDFTPIAQVSDAPMVLAANANTPYKTVADVIAAAKAQPGRISVATPGNGSVNQIVLEWMALNTGTKFQHIPYKGGAPAIVDLVAGQIPIMFDNVPPLLPHVRAGRIKPLAVTSLQRISVLPDVPTLHELGLKDFDAVGWNGLLAPAGTPREIVSRLHAEVVKVLRTPEVRDQLTAQGADIVGNSPEEFSAWIKTEVKKWAEVVKVSGAKID
jgi:tripartite-type tricarboxylate transporter receptor subunit TctC